MTEATTRHAFERERRIRWARIAVKARKNLGQETTESVRKIAHMPLPGERPGSYDPETW